MADFPDDIVDEPTTSFTPINKQVKDEPITEEASLADIKQEVKEESSVQEAPATPAVTPKKRGKKAQNGSAANGDDGTPSKKAKATPSKSIPIPTSFEDAGPEDRMILHMKDTEGRNWSEISAAWESMTGNKSAKGSLHVRYSRMKANFVTFNADHIPVLLEAKKTIETQFESEKWQKIAGAVEAKCGSKYPAATLLKKFKEFNKKNNASAAVVKDED